MTYWQRRRLKHALIGTGAVAGCVVVAWGAFALVDYWREQPSLDGWGLLARLFRILWGNG